MRGVTLTLIFLAAAACSPTSKLSSGDQDLIAIARAEAERRGIPIANVRAPTLLQGGSNLIVVLDPPPPGWKGGGVEVTIDKKTREVVLVERTK